jgi:hypothetical protein
MCGLKKVGVLCLCEVKGVWSKQLFVSRLFEMKVCGDISFSPYLPFIQQTNK